MLGIGNQQHALRFQKPYNLDAASEMTIELIETPIVLNVASKPDMRTQIGSTNTSDRISKSEEPSNNTPVLVAEAHADELTEDYTKWELPKAAKTRLGKGGINVLQFSPDGTQIAVGSNIGVWLYDVETGKEITMFPGVCQAIAFSPDGRFIAGNGGPPGLQLWEIATGQKMSHIEKIFPAAALHFSEDSKKVVSLGNWKDTIDRLDVETGEASARKMEEMVKRTNSSQSYAVTADKFAVGRKGGEIELGNTMTGKKLSTLIGHIGGIQERVPFPANADIPEIPPAGEIRWKFGDTSNSSVLALAFSPDGTRLASGSEDKTVRLWDTDTHDELAILRKHTGSTNALAFSPDGKMLASGSTDKTVQLWDTGTGAHLATLTEHIRSIAALAFSPDGGTLASGSTDGTIRFWNTTTRTLLPIRLTGHTEWMKAVSFFEDSSTLASVDFNGVITLWDLKTSQKIRGQTIVPPDFLLTSAFSPDGTKLVSTGADSATFLNIGYSKMVATREPDHLVRLTDVRTGRELATLKKTVGGMNEKVGMAFSPDGKRVAFYGSDEICVWHTEAGNVLTIPLSEQNSDDAMVNQHMMARMLNEVTVLMFSPDEKKLVSGTMGGKVQMWDAETGVEIAPFLAGQEPDDKGGHGNFTVRYEDPITALAFSSNGVLLAVGSEQEIRLLGSRKQPHLKDVTYGTQSLAFSPDDTVLLAGLRNGGIELLDMTTGEKITTLNGHIAIVETLVFSPDGKTLVSTGQDGTILVWDWDEALKNASVSENSE